MKIGIGSDHGGYEWKEELKRRLSEKGYEVIDKGTFSLEEVDYPDIAEATAHGILNGEYEQAVLVCGTGIGMSIAANKVRGIRAALCCDCFSARMAKEHNNANIIALGARTTGIELAWEILQSYLQAEFLGEKHGVRVEKIKKLEDGNVR